MFRLAEVLTCEQEVRDIPGLGFRASECGVLNLFHVSCTYLTWGRAVWECSCSSCVVEWPLVHSEVDVTGLCRMN